MGESSSWPKWMMHPVVGVLGVVVGMVGIMLAVLIFFVSRTDRRPYYHLEPARNVIVNQDVAIGRGLSISYDGRPINGRYITAMQCQFWNAGRESIRPENVLLPLRLILGEGAEVLDASVVRQTRPSVTDFRVSPDLTLDGRRTNTATLSFKIMERGDGATVQLIYIGGPTVPVGVEGTIEGATIQRLSRPLEPSKEESETWDKRHRDLGLLLAAYAFFPLLGAIFSAMLKAHRITDSVLWWPISFQSLRRGSFWAFQAVWLFLIGMLYYYFFLHFPDIPRALGG